MGFDWSSVIAPVASLAGGLFGASSAADAEVQQFKHQKDLMNHQHDFNVFDYKHRYQWASQDMAKAGLNKILAATNGIGGSINGTSLGNAAMAQTPDYGSMLGQAFSSAYQTRTQKDIAKMANEVEKGKLQLEKENVYSAIDQRRNDMAIAQGRFDLEKWTAQENMRLKQIMQDATIQNMVERLQADIEHMARQDANGAVSAAAAMAQANASGLMAAVQERLGVSREELNKAQEAYIALQSQNAEESLEWQEWLNDHKETRGMVGLLGALFDTFATVKGVKNIGNSLDDLVD